MKRISPRVLVVLVLAGAAAAAVLAAGGYETTSTARASAAVAPSIELTQECPVRVPPRTPVDIRARILNNGDASLTLNPADVVADNGTQDTETDDFPMGLQSGDNGNGRLDPGETWVFGGSYSVGDDDTTSVVSAEATAPDTTTVSDLDGCTTDVIVPPAPGEQARVNVVKGKVRVKVPGSNVFVELGDVTEIPLGSQVDTTKGTVQLTAGLGGGRTNSGSFNGGVFTILQKHAANASMVLRLDKGNFGVCRGSSSNALSLSSVAKKSKRVVRRLLGVAKGRFTTRGRYSSSTVRGTKWLTQDRCDGTLTTVQQGVVLVNDLRKHKNVKVKAGRSYLAKAPGA